MDLEGSDYEMPVPNYAVGIHILLIDPDMVSLMHTTSTLEEATYRVTSTGFPNVALSMIQERGNEYNLVIAAMDMPGMDCLTFLRIAKTLSDIPIVLTSYKMDEQLAIKTIQQGACQFFEKPISRDDARGLWQYVFRKGRKKTANDSENAEKRLHHSDPQQLISKSKLSLSIGDEAIRNKEKEQEILKRKRSYYGNNKVRRNNDVTSFDPESVKRKNKKQKLNAKFENVNWNNELHAKFMNIVPKDSQEVISTTNQQEFGITDLMVLAQNSKEHVSCPCINITPPTRTSNTSDGHRQLQTKAFQGSGGRNSRTVSDTRYARNEFESPGANLKLQSRNVVSSAVSPAAGPSYLSVQNNCPETETRTASDERLSLLNFRTLCGAEKEERARQSPSSNSRSQLELNLGNNVSRTGIVDSMGNTSLLCSSGKQLAVDETTDNPSDLRGKIEKIRHAYRTDNISGKASPIPNTQVETMLLSNNRNYSQTGNRQADVFEGNVTPNYGYNGSSTMNFGFSPSLHVCSPTPAPYTVQSSCTPSKDYMQSFVQSSCNIQVDTAGLCQTLNYPISGSDNSSLVISNGLENQAIEHTNDLGRRNLDNLGVIDSSEEILKNAGASNSQQLTDDDIFFDAILAELRNDFGVGDLKSLGFSSNSDV